MFKIKLISGIAGVKSGFLADKAFEGKTIFLVNDAFDEPRGLNVFEAQETEAQGQLEAIQASFPNAKFELVDTGVSASN